MSLISYLTSSCAVGFSHSHLIHSLIITLIPFFHVKMRSTIVFSLLATLASAAVFSATTFNDLSIAGGTAGNAKAEALAALGGLPTDLTTVDQADIDVCNSSLFPIHVLEPGT